MAQNYAADFSFAVANNNDFNHELEEFGITYVEGDKPAVCAKDADGMKFVMEQEFRWVDFIIVSVSCSCMATSLY